MVAANLSSPLPATRLPRPSGAACSWRWCLVLPLVSEPLLLCTLAQRAAIGSHFRLRYRRLQLFQQRHRLIRLGTEPAHVHACIDRDSLLASVLSVLHHGLRLSLQRLRGPVPDQVRLQQPKHAGSVCPCLVLTVTLSALTRCAGDCVTACAFCMEACLLDCECRYSEANQQRSTAKQLGFTCRS